MTNLPGDRRGLSRRELLRSAGLLAAGGVGLTACGSSLASGVSGVGPGADQLTYWNLFSGGDGVRMVAMEQGYTKTHPQIDLSATTLTWGNPYYTKLELATLGKRPPDVGISHLTRATTLAQADLLTPFDEADLARHGMTADKFTPKAWESAHVGGKLYAIPLDTHPFVLFYNTDICKKAGLLNKDGSLKDIDGPDGLVDALTAAKKVTGEWGGAVSINSDTSTCWRIFQSLYSQLGGEVLADNGRKIVLDDAKATKALAYLQELTVTKKLMPATIDYGGALTLFTTGKAGFFMQGEWEVTTFLTAKTPFSMTRFPNVFGGSKYSVQADSHTFVLPKDPGRNAARLDLDLAFIRNMLDQSMTWAAGGHVPAWLPIQKSAAYKKLKPQSNYVDAAYAAAYDPPGWYSGSGSDFEIVIGSAISAVESGQLTPAAAIAQIRKGLTRYTVAKSPVG
jgi:multiple sugar transport system substrate-binding protein